MHTSVRYVHVLLLCAPDVHCAMKVTHPRACQWTRCNALRLVQSINQPRLDGLNKIILDIKNKLKIGDWEKVGGLYGDLNKHLDKNKKELVQENGKPPRSYLKVVSELDGIIAAAWANKRTLNKLMSKALTGVRGALRKTNKEKVGDGRH